MSLRKKKLKNQRPTSEVCQAESVQNAASTLLANIRFSAVDSPLKTIVVTSSIPNEGKTTVALSLAIAAGRSGDRVLIMEGDMRRRSLRAVLGVKSQHGIHALVTGRCTLDETVVSTEFENVSFIDAEAGIPNPDGILSSRLFADTLKMLRDEYDFVIIDTPPITAFPDASIAASKADACILVARENFTDKREITYALQQLRAADANVLGVALNCQDSAAGGAYGYYYGYYYDEKKVAVDSPEAQEALERVKAGDTHVSVTPVGKHAAGSKAAEVGTEGASAGYVDAADSGAADFAGTLAPVTPADFADVVAPITPDSGPTAAAPGSRR